jgi:hypothetical protein
VLSWIVLSLICVEYNTDSVYYRSYDEPTMDAEVDAARTIPGLIIRE